MTILLNASAMTNPNSALDQVVPRFRKALADMWKIDPKQVPISWTMDEENKSTILFKDLNDSTSISVMNGSDEENVLSCWKNVCNS
jgi:hypothetical protein